jgi:dolichyl-phosphate-mannose-protein mannosyltransferase
MIAWTTISPKRVQEEPMQATDKAAASTPGADRRIGSPWHWTIAVALATVLAVAVRFHVNESGLAGYTFGRHDESHYVDLVRRFLNGNYRVEYFINPTGYAYILHGVTAVAGYVRVALGMEESFRDFVIRETLHPHVIVIVGRVLTILAGVLCVPVIASIGRRLYSTNAGILAAIALAIDRIAARRSHLCGNELPMLLAGLLSFHFLVGTEARRRLRDRILCGLLVGAAAGIKYSGGVFIIPLLVGLGRSAPVAVASAVVGFLATTPSVLLDFSAFLGGFRAQYSFLHQGYLPSDVEQGEHGWSFYLHEFPHTNVGLVFSILCLAGILLAVLGSIRRRDRARHLSLWIIVPLYALLGSGVFCDMRFMLPAIPFILLLGANLLSDVATRLRLHPVVPVLLGAAFMAPSGLETMRLIRKEFAAPDWREQVFPFLVRTAGPERSVVDFTYLPTDLVFDDADPWKALKLASPPDPERVAAVRGGMIARGRLLQATSLRSLFESQRSLAALKEEFAARRFDRVVISIPAKFVGYPDLMVASNGSLWYVRMCDYWREAFQWFATFRTVDAFRSEDRKILVCTLEIPADDGERK